MNRNILIVEARFYDALADALVEGAVHVLEEAGCQYERAQVPGVLEIPVAIAYAAQTGKYDGYVALGVVIRGETTHYDIVCGENARPTPAHRWTRRREILPVRQKRPRHRPNRAQPRLQQAVSNSAKSGQIRPCPWKAHHSGDGVPDKFASDVTPCPTRSSKAFAMPPSGPSKNACAISVYCETSTPIGASPP